MSDEIDNVVPIRKPLEMGDRLILNQDKHCIHGQKVVSVHKRELRCNDCGARLCPYKYISDEMVRKDSNYHELLKKLAALHSECELLEKRRQVLRSSVKGFQEREAKRREKGPQVASSR